MEEFELEPGEAVITQVRQHKFVLALRLIPFALLAILPLFIAPFFDFFASATAVEQGTRALQPLGAYFRFFLGLWWLFLWMGAFSTITKYFLTVWVITTHRIVDIEQFSFFSRKVSSFLLMRVQDVTTDVHGILATLIGYGDINVETAGSMEKFIMPGVKHPEYVRDLIMGEVAKLHQNDAPMASGI
jgi:uncharacterized membrane protein YdbT with pleckstrin-like domain